MFYHYRQNNSGGSFILDDDVTVHVIIEAESAEQADRPAESIGIYFDGCSNGMDCPCCGDRWTSQYNKGDKEPLVYGENPQAFADSDLGIRWWGENPAVYIYYADGGKVAIYSNNKAEGIC
jgi:hypothetical protein